MDRCRNGQTDAGNDNTPSAWRSRRKKYIALNFVGVCSLYIMHVSDINLCWMYFKKHENKCSFIISQIWNDAELNCLLLDDKLFILPSQCHGFWCSGDTRSRQWFGSMWATSQYDAKWHHYTKLSLKINHCYLRSFNLGQLFSELFISSGVIHSLVTTPPGTLSFFNTQTEFILM